MLGVGGHEHGISAQYITKSVGNKNPTSGTYKPTEFLTIYGVFKICKLEFATDKAKTRLGIPDCRIFIQL